ncbi:MULTISPECIES: DUF2288 domain-containing protein [unclassified Coleofasciculus]|uniref:DUF2288 domain-containing protein n=1 Tax=unclassified Coleofasciculus TaxID=2692782 RepID=UPI00187E3968|nr:MULTISPECIES: DUF2288 domain-containing protein [unclassified Coleofasciculus]MBE9127730.1 DUF2288 family protein [Coleofasciculus sp. LEGE 07081]MBE9150698.1 DUF2288 family protein [Coleofasciculus sp. LEGE 07092]
MPDLRAELEQTVDEATWDLLIPHVKRDAVIFVTQELNLVDVGVAIARDDILSIQSWISKQQLHKPFSEQLADWNTDKTKRFQALIVQPYVLVQELAG